MRRKTSNSFDPEASGGRGRGFTLVEMLVVVLVIAILVGIVIGVARIVTRRAAVEQTKVNMKVIRLALDAFRETDGSGDYPPSEITHAPEERCNALLAALKDNPLAREKLMGLSDEAIKSINENDYLVDGFENPMDYSSDGGAGSGPVLTSAGADGDYTTENDNIRSDDQ